MTLQIVRFRPQHLAEIALQSEQQPMREIVDRPEYGAALSLAGPAFTVMLDGAPIACGGVQEYHPQRVEAWALLSDASGPYMGRLTRIALGWLQQCGYTRVEAAVSAAFSAGQRWARLLGFEQEGPVRRAYMPDGGDAYTFVRIRNGSRTPVHDGRRRRGAGDLVDPPGQGSEQRRAGERAEP